MILIDSQDKIESLYKALKDLAVIQKGFPHHKSKQDNYHCAISKVRFILFYVDSDILIVHYFSTLKSLAKIHNDLVVNGVEVKVGRYMDYFISK